MKRPLSTVHFYSRSSGSAAIYGLRGKCDLSIFMLHPKGKVSPVQESQMTTILDSNVHNISVEGSFDDCQDIVKAMFADAEINKTHKLAAVNSINVARSVLFSHCSLVYPDLFIPDDIHFKFSDIGKCIKDALLNFMRIY